MSKAKAIRRIFIQRDKKFDNATGNIRLMKYLQSKSVNQLEKGVDGKHFEVAGFDQASIFHYSNDLRAERESFG
jgi:hypothetical protein